jgi:hypothetical protein
MPEKNFEIGSPSAISLISSRGSLKKKYINLHRMLFPLPWGPVRTVISPNSKVADPMHEK